MPYAEKSVTLKKYISIFPRIGVEPKPATLSKTLSALWKNISMEKNVQNDCYNQLSCIGCGTLRLAGVSLLFVTNWQFPIVLGSINFVLCDVLASHYHQCCFVDMYIHTYIHIYRYIHTYDKYICKVLFYIHFSCYTEIVRWIDFIYTKYIYKLLFRWRLLV